MGVLCQITNNQINLDLIKIIQFHLKIYDLETPPPMSCGWMCGVMLFDSACRFNIFMHSPPIGVSYQKLKV